MASPDADQLSQDAASDFSAPASMRDVTPAASTPLGSIRNGINGFFASGPKAGSNPPVTPPRTAKREPAPTPRFKKKVPWKGKNIMVLLPRDDGRGLPGKAPMPLTGGEVTRMLRSWEELGYDTQGFVLTGDDNVSPLENYSQSRGAWPSFEEMAQEHRDRKFQVTLPDLNAWKAYVDDLQEAKLRALGVSFGDAEPAPPKSISPATSNMSRQTSTQYPPLPFSPPVPTSSASSNHAMQSFPFPFAGSDTQSPGIPGVPSPASFNPQLHGKFNPRQSISIPSVDHRFGSPFQQPSPLGWSPQAMLMQGHARGGSPSLANFSSLMSPTSPFQQDPMQQQMASHQRHQSMQYPMLGHQQFGQPARASPRLQELREVEEEAPPVSKSPSKTPEPRVRHNASDSLQKEIDEAEYHLEEQFRSQLEHDKDYSPHDDDGKTEEIKPTQPADSTFASHAREQSVQFAPDTQFRNDLHNGPPLHHPQPHNRGHSLSQKYYVDSDEARYSTDDGSSHKAKALREVDPQKRDESYEIETNPSNMGTPVHGFDFGNFMHSRSFSTASNPWADAPSAASSNRRSSHISHASKPSLSKLNVEAPEFKFNPANSAFQPATFSFSGNNSQPAVFQAGTTSNAPGSSASSQLGAPSSISKINVSAPVFAPGQSDFNFSSSGPKFRPDAPAFTPLHSISNSITSPPPSGNESALGSIFGNIDLSAKDAVKPAKKSKAIPIVRPSSKQSSHHDEAHEDKDGRLANDESRVKRFRGSAADNNAVPMFAEPTPEPEVSNVEQPAEDSEAVQKTDVPLSDTEHDQTNDATETEPLEGKDAEEEQVMPADTTLSSTIVSDTDAKIDSDAKPATPDLSETSPDQAAVNWGPFEFHDQIDIQNFNDARPFGEEPLEPAQRPGHNKSLSATAKPFMPGVSAWNATTAAPDTTRSPAPSSPEPQGASGLSASKLATSPAATPAPKGLSASRFAAESTPTPVSKPAGLAASRFARTPSPVSDEGPAILPPEPQPQQSPMYDNEEDYIEPHKLTSFSEPPPRVDSVSPVSDLEGTVDDKPGEMTFEEIDAVMAHINESESKGVNRTIDSPQYHQPSPRRHFSVVAVAESPVKPLQSHLRSETASPESRQQLYISTEEAPPMLSTELEDPFIDPPQSAMTYGSHLPHIAAGDSLPASDWEGDFSDEEQEKLESRVKFFDGHVNELVGEVLAAKLDPLEKTLDSMNHVLALLSRRTPSSRRDRRSISAEFQESDADDEDDDVPMRRSMSPRRDKRMEQIRAAVQEAFTTQQAGRSLQPIPELQPPAAETPASVLKAVEDLRDEFAKSLHLDFRGDDLRAIVEDAVDRRMAASVSPVPPPAPIAGETNESKVDELQARVYELEQRLILEEKRTDAEVQSRRAAEDVAAKTRRDLETAETRVEVEIMNRSAFDERIGDLEERLRHSEASGAEDLKGRRLAEDRLSEVQRLLRISSEEESRLRESVEEKDQKIKHIEENRGKGQMRLALLEASQSNAQKAQDDSTNRIKVLEGELQAARNEARHWRGEAESAMEASTRNTKDLAGALDENKHLHKLIDTLGTQLQENERIRESWRNKFGGLQEDMARAAREIAEDNARRTKKEQAMLARQEVLDARLQAESKTRERLETEIERLEMGERQGMRAVNESKRLEGLLGDLRTENHKLHQAAMTYKREFEEARESGAREVQRARDSVQSELDSANLQVNVVREELEEQASKLRAQLDQVRLDADTAKAQNEMLLEEAQSTRSSDLEALERRHQNELEDLHARHERQITNTTEDAQRQEQNLLERLSISASRTEHLQDRVAHLEEKLELAQEAARAAAQAAKSATPTPAAQSAPKPTEAVGLPERISPQALRESIMVLQEQLQAREQRIEELEQTMGKLDPDAPSKISKRDDEITWLRELLAVRHGDLQDIILALSRDGFDKDAVKDAAIRLEANLQMEEQERERAMNGASAIKLPNIGATIQAATPRMAQAVGPLAAAIGNWRKNREPNTFGSSLSSVFSSPTHHTSHRSTPSRGRPASASRSSPVSGLMTPPASGLRDTPTQDHAQPAAFSSTSRRFTGQPLNLGREASITPRQADKMPVVDMPTRRASRGQPMTPPMMRPSAYDSDAQAEDFDDAGFFDD